ncbi:hypothetical protein JCM3765_004821 [Sporobolomyces pararoseus]
MTSPLTTSSVLSSPLPPHKLEPGHTFILRGPSIWRDITPLDNYPPPAPDSSHPPRAIHRALIGPQGMAEASASWKVKVLENFQPYCDCGRHLVDAEIEQGGNDSGPEKYLVRLQLSYPAIRGSQEDPTSQLSSFGYLVRYTLESDASNYHVYRKLQGREIPICYGIFSANLGGVETLVAVVEQLQEVQRYNSNQWANLGAILARASQQPIVTTVSGDSGPALQYSPKMLQVKMESEFECLRRFLSCDPRKLPRLCVINVAISPSSTMDSIRYIHRLHTAATSINQVKEILRDGYLRYCFSNQNKQPPIFGANEFERYLPSLVLLVAEGVAFEDVCSDLKGLLRRKSMFNLTWNDSLPL